MIPTLITCFYGRSEKVERILGFYLSQDYLGDSVLLLYNNGPNEQKLDDFHIPPHKRIILINNHLNLETGREYDNVGDIFRDAVSLAPVGTTILSWFDSDDIFLPTHLSQGVIGMEKARNQGKLAYKPYFSYFIYGQNSSLEHNNLEPSIFVDYEYVKEHGFNKTSASYHDGWLLPLKREQKMLEDRGGASTLIYDWSTGHNTYKISGSGDDGLSNLLNHRRFETDWGDGTLSPAPNYILEQCYNKI